MSNWLHKNGKYGILACIGFVFIFTAFIVVIALGSTSTKKKASSSTSQLLQGQVNGENGKESQAIEDEAVSYDHKVIAIVKDINQEEKSITFFDVETEEEIVLYYSGATNIVDKYEQAISIAQMDIGMIVDAYYLRNEKQLVKMQNSLEAWEYIGVNNLQIDRTNNIMKITEQKYQYTNDLFVYNGKKEINLIDVHEKDELTIRGYKTKIWSIEVTQGHGYVRLQDYDYFIGGNLSIGTEDYYSLTEDMVFTVRVGNYNITIEQGSVSGTKNINVLQDQEIVVSMADFQPVSEGTCYVTFQISPFGADLIIDGELTSYGSEVPLSYGEHTIEVSLGGYITYSSVINLDKSSEILNITLVESSQIVENEDGSNEGSLGGNSSNTGSQGGGSSNNGSNGSNGNTSNKEDEDEDEAFEDVDEIEHGSSSDKYVDPDHFIYINNPEGASVYIDGSYIGVSPVKVKKTIGSHMVTLIKEGYITKTHSIMVVDDKEDLYFNFSDLEKK